MDPALAKILIVDDEPMILSVLREQLEPEGFKVTLVDSGSKAIEALKQEGFSIILADHEMPGMTGLELLGKVGESYPGMIRLMLSGRLAVKELLDAVQSGVIHRYLTKPWLREELLVILRNSVAMRVSESQITIPTSGTASEAPVAETPAGSGEAAADNGLATPAEADAAVDVFLKMLGAFHPNLRNSAIRSMALCKTLGEQLGLPAEHAQSLVWAAGLFDVSLVGVERNIVRRWLRSPDKCTDEEMGVIRKHPNDSVEMLRVYPIFKEAGDILRYHHENWDGTGYPDRLKGETIPWLSRLLAVVIFCCSRHQAPAQIMNEAQSQAGKMFDPKALEAVAKAVPVTEVPRGEREILLIELQAGMVLAKDIYNTSGVMIIAKDKELTSAWINKIQNINNATPLNPYVLVYC